MLRTHCTFGGRRAFDRDSIKLGFLASVVHAQISFVADPQGAVAELVLIIAAKEQWPQIQQWNRRVGNFDSLVFLHVNQQGWDVYDVKYEHGHMILSVGPLTPDHKVLGIFYQSS